MIILKLLVNLAWIEHVSSDVESGVLPLHHKFEKLDINKIIQKKKTSKLDKRSVKIHIKDKHKMENNYEKL